MGMLSNKPLKKLQIIDHENETFAAVTLALREVISKAIIHDGVSRGIREAIRAIEQGSAQLCILAAACDESSYYKIVESLCQEHNVNTILVKEASDLGEWVGLGRTALNGKKKGGQTAKIGCCHCAVITDFGEQSAGLTQ